MNYSYSVSQRLGSHLSVCFLPWNLEEEHDVQACSALLFLYLPHSPDIQDRHSKRNKSRIIPGKQNTANVSQGAMTSDVLKAAFGIINYKRKTTVMRWTSGSTSGKSSEVRFFICSLLRWIIWDVESCSTHACIIGLHLLPQWLTALLTAPVFLLWLSGEWWQQIYSGVLLLGDQSYINWFLNCKTNIHQHWCD